MTSNFIFMTILASVAGQETNVGISGTINIGGNSGEEEKQGVCPPVAEGQVGICQHECDFNADCADNKLCCSNGCGHICIDPMDLASTPHKAAECSMMLTFQQKPDNAIVESLMGQIPEPIKKSFLHGVGILILDYGINTEQCCKATRFLSRHENVKSVEYDGPTPDCPREL